MNELKNIYYMKKTKQKWIGFFSDKRSTFKERQTTKKCNLLQYYATRTVQNVAGLCGCSLGEEWIE